MKKMRIALALVVSAFMACFTQAEGAAATSLPKATVTQCAPLTLTAAEHDYMVWPSGDDTVARPLQIVMNFKAQETLDEAKAGAYGKYKCDFYLTLEGLAGDSITADGCYLAGNYGSFGWIVIPTDGTVLEEGVSYPIVSAYDANLTYEDICGSVKDFTAAIYVAPTILAANPDFKVSLALKMTDPNNEANVLTIGTPATYTVKDLLPLPTATVTTVKNDDLTFALNFKADSATEAQLATYGNWYADFVLTVNKDVTFNANGGADGYLAGQYDEWSENWVNVPFENVTLKANESLKIMAYAAEMMGQSGLKLTYNDVVSFVKDFDCGVFFEPTFLAANPDLNVTLELRMYNPANEAESYVIGETYTFPVPLPTATVTELNNKDLTFALNFKADSATEAQLATYGNWYADFVLTVNKDVTFNADGGANGYLSGQYDAWSENWVNVPFEDVTLEANKSLKIMAYAAEMMGQSGLKLTYNDVVSFVKDFDCGVFFESAFLAANPDLNVTLELRMYNPANEAESYVIGKTYTFNIPTVEVKIEVETDTMSDKQKEAVAEIVTNTVVTKADTGLLDATAEITAAKEALENQGVTAEAVANAVPVIAITVKTVEFIDEEPSKLTFDVTPTLSVGETSVEMNTFEKALTFRLPVPAAWAGFAKVFHDGKAMGVYEIKEENGGKYVEVASDSFSEFAVELAAVELPGDDDKEASDAFAAKTVFDGANYYDTLQAAVEAVCGTNGATLYCKPGADVGSLQHAPVTATLTIYGNGAYVSGGENRDFDIGNTDPNGPGAGKVITADMTLMVKDLAGCGAWGTKATEHTVNLVFENCANMGKVWLNGTTGTLNITMTNCAFEGVIKEAVYSNADGAITLTNVDFSNLTKAVNLNHKAAGTQTVTITDCSFTNCGADVANDQIPVRVLSSVEGGKSVLTVSGTTFTGTPTDGADILLDYGVGETTASVTTTTANVKVETEENVGTTTNVTSSTETKEFTNVLPAAKIGDTPYATLADAVAAANKITDEQVTITMLADAEFAGDDLYANLVLDLNGKTITATGPYVFWFEGGALTVKDSSAEQTGMIDGSATVGNAFLLMGEESLTIESGKIHANNNVIYTYGSGVTVTINGGELKSYIDSGNIFYLVGANDKITVNGGTFIGNVNPFAAGLSIKGGQFTADVNAYCAANRGAVKNGDGMYEIIEINASNAAAQIGDKYYLTLGAAINAAGDNDTIYVLKDVTEGLPTLRGKILPANGNVTITATNSDWLYCAYTFVIGEGVTLNVPALFYYAGGAQINGTVITKSYYQRYAGTKLTINEPGSMTVTSETFILRLTDGDANAGIYINGDNNDETVGLNLAVAYFYQGMINAKDANIKVGTYWQTQEDDGQGSANLILDNTVMNVTSENLFKATGNSTVTLTNGSAVTVASGYQGVAVSMDDTSSFIKNGVSIFEAKVNDRCYATLADALAAAQAGDTIDLLKDVTMSGPVLLDKSITINGNGNTITSPATRVFRITTGNVQVTMNELNIVSTAVRASNVDSIRGISIDGGFTGIELTLNDCSVDFTDATASDCSYAVNIVGGSNHTLTVNGGTYEGANVINLWGTDHKVTITGATLNNIYGINDQYYGGIVRVESQIDELTLKNNTFNGTHAKVISYAANASVESLVEENNIDNTKRYVVKVDSNYYYTLEDAIAAATEGDTVTLLASITSSEIITINKAITLDGNGKKLTSTAGRAINVSGANGVTIKNLTINCTGERAINIIQNATNVTIDNVTATAANYTVNVASSAPNAVVAITNSNLTGLCTVNVAAAGADVTIDNSTVNCNDNNTTAGESYAALSLNKDAVGGSIIATNTTVNVTADSDSMKGRNGAKNGIVTINGSTDGVAVMVAAITYEGSDYYHAFASLAEAIEFAKAGQTITLIRPIVVAAGETLNFNKAVTITYTSAVPGEDMITNKGTLIVDGASLIYTNTDTTASNVTVSTISCEPGSLLEVKSGLVQNDSANNGAKGIYAYAIDLLTNGSMGDVTATISGGKIVSTNYMAIRQFNNGTACKNTLTITGGEITAATRAIQIHLDNNAAYTTISGGTITAGEGGYALCFFPTNATNIVVTGGTFNGLIYSGSDGFIAGGTFDADVYSGYCAAGYKVVKIGDTYCATSLDKFVAGNLMGEKAFDAATLLGGSFVEKEGTLHYDYAFGVSNVTYVSGNTFKVTVAIKDADSTVARELTGRTLVLRMVVEGETATEILIEDPVFTAVDGQVTCDVDVTLPADGEGKATYFTVNVTDEKIDEKSDEK